MWGRKRKIEIPDDTGEAQVMRAQGVEELHRLQRQKSEVVSLKERLDRRRDLNHFGEEISLSFRPRGRQA